MAKICTGTILAILAFLVVGCLPPESYQTTVTITRGNNNGAAFVHDGNSVEVHLKLLNESDLRADQLDVTFRFQFGTDQNSETLYWTETYYRVLRPGNAADFDAYISESQLPGGVRFADLSLASVSEIAFYNFQQDATRPVRTQVYQGVTLYSGR